MDTKATGLASGEEGSVRRVGAILGAASLVVVVVNEVCQRLVARGIIDNHFSRSVGRRHACPDGLLSDGAEPPDLGLQPTPAGASTECRPQLTRDA